MSITIVHDDWIREFKAAMQATEGKPLRIMCPFIQSSTIRSLLDSGKPSRIQVITRFSLNDCAEGVNDLNAFSLLLDKRAEVRGLRNLHAKVYLFGSERVIVTSANLTNAAFRNNHEMGIASSQEELVRACSEYFNGLWPRVGENLTRAKLEKWQKVVNAHFVNRANIRTLPPLGDEGVAIELSASFGPSGRRETVTANGPQAFVKFMGEGDNRVALDQSVMHEIRDAGCHWAATYPKSKRPRSVHDGDVIFFGRLTHDPNDIFIIGRAIGLQHVDDRDVATPEDIKARPWKVDWPNYIRVQQPEFVQGVVGNGVSLNGMMDHLGSDSFEPTYQNAIAGKGNTNPRKAYRQQAAVKLTAKAAAYMSHRLDDAMATHGRISNREMDSLDWPKMPSK